MRILVIEDNNRFGQLVVEHLSEADYIVDLVGRVEEFYSITSCMDFDLYIIDLGLPDGDGIKLIERLRRNNKNMPIIIVTARAGLDEKIKGLDAGADDYLVKPFNHQELLARIRAVLRRKPTIQSELFTAGSFTFNLTTGDLNCGDRQLKLRRGERRLLTLLIQHTGTTVTRELIENRLKNFQENCSSNAIDKMVSRLRKALVKTKSDLQLKTVRGVGYVLEEARR
ncbi:MAG: response regulator transcription factor [Hyphomicrobiaceae bacterium]|nr:response regulator transcription factor [Hyphomicrobiaceae bacterium]